MIPQGPRNRNSIWCSKSHYWVYIQRITNHSVIKTHAHIHCGTVYNSKDLEPTQMPINGRLDKENVAHIHRGILCSNQKWWVRVLCRNVYESGEHHSQQTDTLTENEILHILTHRWVINNENTWTQEKEHYTLGSIGGISSGVSCRRIAWGEMPDVGEGEEDSKSHCHVCAYATILHVLHMYSKT